MPAPQKRKTGKTGTANPKPNLKLIPDFFDAVSNNKAAVLAVGFIVFIAIIIFRDYFFDKVYFFSDIGDDSIKALYPYMYHTADYISKYGIPKWSFQVGMGQNLFPLFLRDPFDIFFYIAGKDSILRGALYVEIAKILFGGIFFFYYLKTMKLSNYTSLIGSLLFAFCGFMLIGAGWYIFSYEAFNMAVLLLAFEQLFTKQKWYLFPIAIFLIGISMPFNLYIYGVFLAFYAILRQLQTTNFNLKKLGLLFLKMVGLSAIGLLLSAPFLIENIFQLFESPRGNGSSSFAHVLSAAPLFGFTDKAQLGTCIMRFFSSEILGSGSAYKGWGNILEAPLFYCGLPCLLLLPQIFQFLNKRVKIVFIIFLTIWLLPIIFPYFRHAFWLFTGDYYRAYSFFVALVFLYYSLQALEFITRERKINRIVLITTLVVLLILINYPFFENDAVNADVSFFVMIMLVVYAVILFFISKQNNATILKWTFLACVVVELIYLSNISVNNRGVLTTAELSQKTGYNDYTVDAVKYIKKHDQSPFYRIDKMYTSAPTQYPSYDDAMIQGYYGTSCYSSFNQQYYIYYLELMGKVDRTNELYTRDVSGLVGDMFLGGENGVKYTLMKNRITPYGLLCLDSLTKIGDVTICRSKFVLPFGYTYTHFINENAFDSLSAIQKQHVSLVACVLNDKDAALAKELKLFHLRDTLSAANFTFDTWGNDIKELKKDTLTLKHFSPNLIKGTINSSGNEMMYLSIPFDKGWRLDVDGHPADITILDAGMIGIMLTKGNHAVRLNYDLRFFNTGLWLCLAGLLIYAGLWFYTRRENQATA